MQLKMSSADVICFNTDFYQYPTNIFVMKMLYDLYICCIYSNAIQTSFIMEANNMSPDQTVPLYEPKELILIAITVTKKVGR